MTELTLVDDRDPEQLGLYVVYTNDGFTDRFAGRELLSWHGRWYRPMSDQTYRGHVYGWIGPLPAMELATMEVIDGR